MQMIVSELVRRGVDIRVLVLVGLMFAWASGAVAQEIADTTPTDRAEAAELTETATPNLANAAPPKPASLSLFFENDGTFTRPNHNSDRHYTSGQGFAIARHQNGGDAIADTLGLSADGTAVGLTLVQQIFTPDNIGPALPDPNDRPYAGYLYLGGYWQREKDDVFDHVELDLGVVGPSSLAEPAQEWIHDLFDEPDPNWTTQLGDEFAYNLTLRRKWRMTLWGEAGFEPGAEFAPGVWGLQLIPEVGLDVGSVYRRVNAGGTLRFGFNLPDDFGPARLTDPGSATGQPVQGLSTYAFVKGIGRYVEWNTFIEGNNERNPSRSVSLEPWVGEIGGGFAVDWRRGNWTFSATYQQLYFSREFEEQTTDDGLGAIALRALYEF
ncbi:MAG: lipid A deacylase LpxR family protein [Planctomycetota bacterium]